MALEFKKLSDVESVEVVAETANVLIEEDGVIKKAPKTQVGGASGSGSDNIFFVTQEKPGNNANEPFAEAEAALLAGKQVLLKQLNGDTINIYAFHHYNDDGSGNRYIKFVNAYKLYSNEELAPE